MATKCLAKEIQIMAVLTFLFRVILTLEYSEKNDGAGVGLL
jgi:hypothetical protein